MSKRETPAINAGSMADIAFLLLIFFLVTTTLDAEEGIPKMLPKKIDIPEKSINERNVLEIAINAKNEIQLENSEIVSLKNLKQHIIDFIDNAGAKDQNGNICDWCNGLKISSSSDHPAKAVISVETSRSASYHTFIAVHNEINIAYASLRDKVALSSYGTSFSELVKMHKRDKSDLVLKAKIDDIKEKYPIRIFDKEPAN